MSDERIARMNAEERRALLSEIAAMVAGRELSFGEASRLLRSGVLELDRERFAQAVGISKTALTRLEDDPDANPTLETLNRVFEPFGGRMALIFPPMEQPPPDEPARQRRELIQRLLAKGRRKRRKPS